MSYGYDSYQPQQQAQPSLDFYSPNPSVPSNSSFYAARPSLDGERSNVSGAIGRSSTGNNYGEVGIGNEVVEGWLNAFGTGGIEGEMPLLEGRFSCRHSTETRILAFLD